ncbi:MAG: diguanylate cyclase [Actinomycetota bacterium]|nr:diguanylate cyclase [Actinomycetota bacterium]
MSVLFVAAGALGYGAVAGLVRSFEQSAAEASRELAYASSLRVALSEQESAAHGLVDEGSVGTERFVAADAAVAELFGRVDEVLDGGSELELVAEARDRWDATFGDLRAAVADDAIDGYVAGLADREGFHFELAMTADGLIMVADELAEESSSEIDERLAEARVRARRLTVAFGALFAAFAAVAIHLFRHTRRDVLVPLRDLHDTAVRYGRGDLRARPGSFRVEELADVARAFEAMAASLDEHRRRLTDQAYTDGLTGLPNRRSLIERLERLVAAGTPGGVMYIDLDDFKLVNDGLGHAAGDALLREVAARLGGAVRRTDLVARLGGDEFAVLLAAPAGEEDARQVAARVVDAVREPFDIGGSAVQVGASVGVSLCRPGLEDASILLSEADVAMYAAKAASAAGVEIFEPARHRHDGSVPGERLRALTERRQPAAP